MGHYAFKTQLRADQVGEVIWYDAHRADVLKVDNFKFDFVTKDTNEPVELKTDFWDMGSTPNFFFERYSDVTKQSPGGPWQSLVNGGKYFVYFYVSNLTYFKFETEKLVAFLDTVIPTLKPTEVRNTSHITVGYRVPREMLKDLTEPVKLSVSSSCPLK